jgi:hypothetical protein
MRTDTRNPRRVVLVWLACAPALPLMAHSSLGFAAGERCELIAARLQSLVANPRHARILGRSYRAQFPAEHHPGVLSGLIRSSLGLGESGAMPLSRDALLSVLNARLRVEFGAGDIVRLDGWILARTEARLCAPCA